MLPLRELQPNLREQRKPSSGLTTLHAICAAAIGNVPMPLSCMTSEGHKEVLCDPPEHRRYNPVLYCSVPPVKAEGAGLLQRAWKEGSGQAL